MTKIVSIMAEWEDAFVSPLKFTSLTTVTQQRIPCSTHKNVWEIRTLEHLKVGGLEQAGEAGQGWVPQMQYSAHCGSSNHSSDGEISCSPPSMAWIVWWARSSGPPGNGISLLPSPLQQTPLRWPGSLKEYSNTHSHCWQGGRVACSWTCLPSPTQLTSQVKKTDALNSTVGPASIASRGAELWNRELVLSCPPPPILAEPGRSSGDASKNTDGPAKISKKVVALGAHKTFSTTCHITLPQW